MQTTNWHTECSIDTFIKKYSHELSFIELIKILNTKDTNKNFNQLFETLEIEPNLSLSFPSSDIEKVDKKNGKYQIKTNFLSLYGSSSPLPTFYTEDLIEEEQEGKMFLKDFYNIFNKQKYQQYFYANIKYRLTTRILENNEADILSILYSFIGQNDFEEIKSLKYFKKNELLKFAQLFLHSIRSKDGLIILIKGLLDINVKIDEYIKSYEIIPHYQLCKIGQSNCGLGENIHLGNRIIDISSTFQITLCDLNKKSFTYFQKKQLGYKKLEELIYFYLGKSLKWIIKYELHNDHKVSQLGDTNWLKLGENSWIN